MHRPSFIVTMVFLVLQPLVAQSNDSPQLEKKKGLVFFFDAAQLLAGFGGKYWINDHQFIRAIVYGTYNEQKTDRPPTNPHSEVSQSKYADLNFSFDFANQFNAIEDLIPYWGANLGSSWYLSKITWTSSTDIVQTTSEQMSFGVGAFVGIEYFITSRVSLSGEQRIFVSFGWGNHYEKSFFINNSTSMLLLSVYL